MTSPSVASRPQTIIANNSSGGALARNRAVRVDTGTDISVTTTTTVSDQRIIGVTTEPIAAGAKGRIQISGVVLCLIQGAVTRGHYLRASATAGALEDEGTLAAAGAGAPLGTCAIALQGGSSGATILVVWIGISIGGSGAAPPFNETPWMNAPGSPHTTDDDFADASGQSGPVNGVAGKWSWRNQSTATLTFPYAGVAKLTIPTHAAGANNLRGVDQATGGDGAWQVYVELEASAADFANAGMWMIDGANGDLYTITLYARAVNGNVRTFFQMIRWTNVTTYNSDPLPLELGTVVNGIWFKMQLLSGNIVMFASTGGLGWIRLGSFADAVGVTRVGIMANEANNTGNTAAYFKHFRKVV